MGILKLLFPDSRMFLVEVGDAPPSDYGGIPRCFSRTPGSGETYRLASPPNKWYFKPKKPVNKMTEEELDEFAKFVFDNLIGDIEDDGRNNDESR